MSVGHEWKRERIKRPAGGGQKPSWKQTAETCVLWAFPQSSGEWPETNDCGQAGFLLRGCRCGQPGQRLAVVPMHQKIGNGFPQARVRLDEVLRELRFHPLAQCFHERPAVLLMKAQAVLRR